MTLLNSADVILIELLVLILLGAVDDDVVIDTVILMPKLMLSLLYLLHRCCRCT